MGQTENGSKSSVQDKLAQVSIFCIIVKFLQFIHFWVIGLIISQAQFHPGDFVGGGGGVSKQPFPAVLIFQPLSRVPPTGVAKYLCLWEVPRTSRKLTRSWSFPWFFRP